MSNCADAFASLTVAFQRNFILISVDSFCRSGSISRGFRGEFKNWHIIPGLCESSPVMENQFSVMLLSYLVSLLVDFKLLLDKWRQMPGA